MKKSTVVIHIDEMGNVETFADGDVDVIWCSELTPNDRCYRATPEPIPDDLLDERIGYQGDGSDAADQLAKHVKEAYGIPSKEDFN